MNKKEIIEEIAKRHHIILDENDPIFAVVSTNEILFDSFLEKINNQFIKNKADLETYKVNIFQELEKYSKNNQENLKNILEQAKQNKLLQTPQEIQFSNEKNKIFKWFLILTGQIVFLLVGIIIGTLI